MALTEIFRGTSKKFKVSITVNGVAPNISQDTVTLTIKNPRTVPDAEALLQKDGDVTTDGANGVALFTLTPSETLIGTGPSVYDIVWHIGSDEQYLLMQDQVWVLDRVSDP